MSSSYYLYTVFYHEQSSKSARDRCIGIASLREHINGQSQTPIEIVACVSSVDFLIQKPLI